MPDPLAQVGFALDIGGDTINSQVKYSPRMLFFFFHYSPDVLRELVLWSSSMQSLQTHPYSFNLPRLPVTTPFRTPWFSTMLSCRTFQMRLPFQMELQSSREVLRPLLSLRGFKETRTPEPPARRPGYRTTLPRPPSPQFSLIARAES